MMHDNSWGMNGGMYGIGGGMWIIPLAIILVIVFLLRRNRKK